MTSTRRIKQFAVAASALLLATASFAQQAPNASSNDASTSNSSFVALLDGIPRMAIENCAISAPSPTPQGVQVIHVCNNWTASAGAQVQLFNTTGTSCTISASPTTWPFPQSSPFSIADGNGLFVTLLTTLHSGTVYYYDVSCCPQNTLKTVTVS